MTGFPGEAVDYQIGNQWAPAFDFGIPEIKFKKPLAGQ
jgi:hypothetical protein